MAAHKSLLLRVEVRPAGKRCSCKHNSKHIMVKGDPRLAVREPGPGTPERGYCSVCAEAMIAQAEQKLAELRERLR